MDSLTSTINERSIEGIKNQINMVNNSNPYFANNQTILNTVTDYDHFPYSRWFRGVSYYPEPIVAEREAGYRKLENSCYNVNRPRQRQEEISHCFEPACSTIFPCVPKASSHFSEREADDRKIEQSCLVQYR